MQKRARSATSPTKTRTEIVIPAIAPPDSVFFCCTPDDFDEADVGLSNAEEDEDEEEVVEREEDEVEELEVVEEDVVDEVDDEGGSVDDSVAGIRVLVCDRVRSGGRDIPVSLAAVVGSVGPGGTKVKLAEIGTDVIIIIPPTVPLGAIRMTVCVSEGCSARETTDPTSAGDMSIRRFEGGVSVATGTVGSPKTSGIGLKGFAPVAIAF
jgi:hypothetical protein